MRAPNSEQKLAIEHDGGVLLSAGAGSGKTFVLVEHIIFLLNKFFDENGSLESDDAITKLKNYLSGIVLMTFTRKAAGELALRLQKRIELEARESNKWDLAVKAINSMFVGTIHGFCNRLIKQGFFVDVDPGVELISEIEFKGAIERLLERWYLQRCLTKFPEVAKIIVLNRKAILNSVVSIFGDPGLRESWAKTTLAQMTEIRLEHFFKEYFCILGVNELGRIRFILQEYAGEKNKKWYGVLEGFSNLPPLKTEKDVQEYLNFFAENKVLRAPAKGKGFDDVILVFDQIKVVRSFLRENDRNISAYVEHRTGIFKRWCQSLKDLVEYIENFYGEIGGITFGDLEYVVLRNGNDSSVMAQINKSYHYFIVDEFQDTSSVQFSILKKMVKGDLGKIFCVGDVKQAIYGFRGGELGVFLECQKEINQNLTMTNNYRSCPNIINFNNIFFDDLFRRGFSFEGLDQHRVDVKHQTVPTEGSFAGEIYCEKIIVADELKISTSQMVEVEAQFILKKIMWICEKFPGEEICVLYRKLGPANILIEKLLRENVDFTAQVKVPLEEDPLLGIIVRLLEELFEEDASRRLTELLLTNYFKILGFEIPPSWGILLEQFYADISLIGVVAAFRKFLFCCGIVNSNYKNNLRQLEAMERIAKGSLEKLWISLKNSSSSNYSIEFQKGLNAAQIRIMTAHASKGLEFNHVILGGIHNNGVTPPNRSYFGDLPGSFRWKSDASQKKPFKSLQFILEEETRKQKEFSESKRLFYVAATRAVKTLSWIDIYVEGKPVCLGKNSWINGIRILEESVRGVGFVENIHEVIISQESTQNNKTPLFHDDRMGLVQSVGEVERKLVIVSELSVTRLATIVSCPRKFYLQNICKIDMDSIDQEKIEREDWLMTDTIRSSALRGTTIHDMIAQLIDQRAENTSCLSDISAKDRQAIEWILSIIATYYSSHQLISEKAIKFSLFGMMVSGIPDLLILGPGDRQVWDFKTGQYSEQKASPYWFQLMVYALACYGDAGKDEKITLVLAFVDEQKCYTKELSFEEIRDIVAVQWKKLACLSQVNDSHCSSCQFSSLCMH